MIGHETEESAMTSDQPAVIAVDDLRKTYPNGVEALRGISFTVEEDEIFGLLGPNGAGKTTTIGILTTTVVPTGGSAVVAGYDVATAPVSARAALGVVFQESVLDIGFSGLANLRLQARLWGMPRREREQRIEELLATVGLSDRARQGVETYSGGMRRRLEIARALLTRPRLVILDEPTVGLDPAVRQSLWDLITRLRRDEGATVLVSTHYLEEAEKVCDRVAVINEGELVAVGTPRELIASLGREVVEWSATSDAGRLAAALTRRSGERPTLMTDGSVGVVVDEPPPDLSDLFEGLRASGLAESFTVRPTTLNDVYLHLTANGSRRRQPIAGGAS
jgi:ABC-2 type transport system ATP-binding protein